MWGVLLLDTINLSGAIQRCHQAALQQLLSLSGGKWTDFLLIGTRCRKMLFFISSWSQCRRRHFLALVESIVEMYMAVFCAFKSPVNKDGRETNAVSHWLRFAPTSQKQKLCPFFLTTPSIFVPVPSSGFKPMTEVLSASLHEIRSPKIFVLITVPLMKSFVGSFSAYVSGFAKTLLGENSNVQSSYIYNKVFQGRGRVQEFIKLGQGHGDSICSQKSN
ncbi:uncharacterized protein LOC116267233 [Nymphaea colorata]|uniref:uncharacterized protein LOC116267233 n=1 Tax=Nymphaea colorata TaxID=210225 RepID=UPI00214F0603|nr:uncharacterized protein LOC116267233 [Nymphaea colorata]